MKNEPIVKACACGQAYTAAAWRALADAKEYEIDFSEVAPGYEPEPGEPTVSRQEQRYCPCGSHLVVELARDGELTPVGHALAALRLGPDRLPLCTNTKCVHAMTSHDTQSLESQCTVSGCPCRRYEGPRLSLIAMLAAAAVMILFTIGCGGATFSSLDKTDANTVDSGLESDANSIEGDASPDTGANTDAPVARDSGTTIDSDTNDAGHEAAPPTEAGNDAAPPACMCGSTTSCWYVVSEPASGSGAAYPVTTVVLAPGKNSSTFTATITTPPTPDHNAVWYDLDVSSFPNGGTLDVHGVVGATGTDASAFLVTQCYDFPASGSFTPAAATTNVGNIAPGMTWAFGSYTFAAGTTVLHLGTEGSWFNASVCPACIAGATNTNTITVRVQ